MTRIAAIWARISRPEQESLPSQVARAKGKLEAAGYTVPTERILAVDWASLDLFNCPEFQKLRQWIEAKEVQAIGILDRDRLEAIPVQRVLFLTLCRKAGVELVVCQGAPVTDDHTGELVEFALAWGKELAVMRAKQGAKDGLHDRAIRDRLPTSHHKVYGYRWAGSTPEELKLSRKLEPDDNWHTVKLYFDMLLKGAGYDTVIKNFRERGVLSPDGEPEWNKATLSAIAHNPIYAGCYYALKKQAIEPKKRRGKTYGNSSQCKLPLEQSHYLPEIEILCPPITWEQRLQILHQLEQHQKLAQRNAQRDYLLRGFIFCETHRGKRGEPRHYHGQPQHDSWRYVCPVGGCTYPYFNGPWVEEYVKAVVTLLLVLEEPDDFYKSMSNKRSQDDLERELRKELSNLEAKYNRNINSETELERRSLLGQEDEEVYRRLKSTFKAERSWIKERQTTVLDELAQLGREVEAAASLHKLRLKFADRIVDLTQAEWRELLTALHFELHIKECEDHVLSDAWLRRGRYVPPDYDGLLVFQFGIPLDTLKIKQIVSSKSEGLPAVPPEIRKQIKEVTSHIVFNSPGAE